MTLGEFIKQYREEHNLSVRAFASQVGISPQAVLNIENGIGSNGKPMTSTMKTYKKIAEGLGMTEQELLNLLNDNDRIIVNPSDNYAIRQDLLDSYDFRAILSMLEDLPEERMAEVKEMLRSFKEQNQWPD